MTVTASFTQNGASVSAQQQRMSQGYVTRGQTSGSNLDTRLDGVGGVWLQQAALRVEAQTSPNMSVKVYRGMCVVPGLESVTQGNYFVVNDAQISSLAVGAAHASLYRIDSVVVRVKDSVYSGASNLGEIVVVAGVTLGASEAAAAAPGAAQIGNSYLVLFNIVVRPATSSILSTDLRDVRRWLTPPGAIAIPKAGELGDPATVAGEWRDSGTSLDRWDGSAWKARHYVDQVPHAYGTLQRSDGTLNINGPNIETDLRVNSVSATSGWTTNWAGSGLNFPRLGIYTVTVSFHTSVAAARYIEVFLDVYLDGVNPTRQYFTSADTNNNSGFGICGGTLEVPIATGQQFSVLFRAFCNPGPFTNAIRSSTKFDVKWSRPYNP